MKGLVIAVTAWEVGLGIPTLLLGFQSTSGLEPGVALAYLNTPLITTEPALSLGVMSKINPREILQHQIPRKCKLRARQAQVKGPAQISLYQLWI